MHKDKLILFVIFILTQSIYSQEILFEQEVSVLNLNKKKSESYPIVDNHNQTLSLFLLDKDEISGYLFNSEFEIQEVITTSRPENQYSILLGSNLRDNRYNLFFTVDKKNSFYIKTIDFGTGESKGTTLNLDLKNEKFLESISYNNNFYLLTIKKKSSILKCYVFEGKKIESLEFDFSDFNFSSTGFTRLFFVLDESTTPFQPRLKIHKIDIEDPNPLDLASEENKLFYLNNKIYLTLDNNIEYTNLITIDLDDFSSNIRSYRHIDFKGNDRNSIKTNSFINDDVLFQIKGSRSELILSAIDLKSDSLLKIFRVHGDEEITFRNSPIMQDGGSTIFSQDAEKELESTKKILRKIADSDIGISVYQKSNIFEVLIGGYKKYQNNGGSGPMWIPSGPTTVSTPYGQVSVPPTYHYNPTYYSFNSYTSSRSVYFKSLIDITTLHHMKGIADKNIFEIIDNFSNRNDSKITSETVFRMNDYYVFGYYDTDKEKYFLRKFKD